MLALLLPAPAAGHGLGPDAAWFSEPLAALPLVLVGMLYGAGIVRLWRRGRRGRGIGTARVAAFAAGWLAAALALLSPLHPLGEMLFWAHMTQHVLLMSVAAPLLVLGRPLPAMMWGLPPRVRHRTGALLATRAARRARSVALAPAVAWTVFAVALWLWHAPALYDASLRSSAVHAVQHVCFFGAALLFWWALAESLSSRRAAGIGMIYVFTTGLHSSLLGALLTFATRPWYVAYHDESAVWGVTPLEDLQLGGLVMWVPGGFAYLIAVLMLAARWIEEPKQRVTSRQPVPVSAPALLLALAVVDCGPGGGDDAIRAIGDASRGPALIRAYGCHACHQVPGVRGADGRVGPPLAGLSQRRFIAGSMPNTPENLVRWIRSPREVHAHTAMPDVGVTEQDASDIAAYLYDIGD